MRVVGVALVEQEPPCDEEGGIMASLRMARSAREYREHSNPLPTTVSAVREQIDILIWGISEATNAAIETSLHMVNPNHSGHDVRIVSFDSCWVERANEAVAELTPLAHFGSLKEKFPPGSPEDEVSEILYEFPGWERDAKTCARMLDRILEWALSSDDIGVRTGYEALAKVLSARAEILSCPVVIPRDLAGRVNRLNVELTHVLTR